MTSLLPTLNDLRAAGLEMTWFRSSGANGWRERVYVMQGRQCAYCGRPATSLDHVIPKARGGSDSLFNLVPACKACNGDKADLGLVVWLLMRQSRRRRRRHVAPDVVPTPPPPAPQAVHPRVVRYHDTDFVRFAAPDPMNPFSD